MEKKRLKIAFVNFTQGTINRGAETFVSELSARLEKQYSVSIFSNNQSLPGRWSLFWRVYLDPQGLEVFWFTLKYLSKIWKEKFDIVIPLNGGWQAVLIRFMTYIYGGKMVISGQSGKGWDDRVNLLSFPDAFVALSSLLTRWAKGVNPFIKVFYIPNGVDINRFSEKGEGVNLNLPKPRFICVGALTKEKRIDLTIKAVAKLNRGSLLVVGDGPLRNSLKGLGDKLLGDRFKLVKAQFIKMPEYYRAADIFSLASPWYRSFEIVIVEAMASNLPVVVNEDPIRREIVGQAGLFVEPTNIEQYSKALKQSLDLDWGDKPRMQSLNFSWDKIAIEYEKIFLEITKK